MKKITALFALIFSIFISAQTQMTIPEIKEFVRQTMTDSREIQTLQTEFTQTKTSEMLNKPVISTGKMAMKMPNQMSWKYQTPTPVSVISKDNKLYISNNGKQTTFDAKSKMFEKISRLMVGSANGSMFTDPDFYVIYFKNGNTNMARFIPKTKQLAKYVRQMELYFPAGKPTVSQVKMIDASGDLTTINFKNTKINEPIPAAVFEL